MLAALLAVAACNRSGRPPLDAEAAARATEAPVPDIGSQGGSYTVAEGDTIYQLSSSFRVSIRELIEVNGLRPPYRLTPGQVLTIPARREHVVQAGDTIYGISRRYGIDRSSLIRLNGIQPPYIIRIGQRLLLPASVRSAVANAEAPAATPTEGPAPDTSGAITSLELTPPEAMPAPRASVPPPQPLSPSAAPPAKPEPAIAGASSPASDGRFLWPVNGKLLSRFGEKAGGLRNDGLNIAAPRGAPVKAAEAGVVAYVGNEMQGFGNLLLIRHANGWTSAYAHNDRILVKRGDRVKRGQTVARVGSTGNVAEPQLHFEIRRGTEAVDPLPHLASSGA